MGGVNWGGGGILGAGISPLTRTERGLGIGWGGGDWLSASAAPHLGAARPPPGALQTAGRGATSVRPAPRSLE